MGELVPVLISEKIIIPLAGRQSRAASFSYFILNVFKKGERAAEETIRSERSDQPLTRCCPRGISWWKAPLGCATPPKGRKTVGGLKKKKKKEKKCFLLNENSLVFFTRVPVWVQMPNPRVLAAMFPESRGETAAPWRPQARRKRSCAGGGGGSADGSSVREADYRLPPPGFAYSESEHHGAAQPSSAPVRP